MPRSTGHWEGDLGFGDAYVWLGAQYWEFIATTAPTFTRVAAGNYNWTFAAAQTITAVLPLSAIGLQRTGYKYGDQEQFGGAFGPGPNAGNPPFTGATQLTPLSAFIPKGLEIQDITLAYSISTANLTSQTPLLKSAVFANTTAVAVSTVTLAATALATLSTTNPYVTKLAVSSPSYTVTDLTALTFENTIVAPSSSVYALYGAFVHMTFNNQ